MANVETEIFEILLRYMYTDKLDNIKVHAADWMLIM